MDDSREDPRLYQCQTGFSSGSLQGSKQYPCREDDGIRFALRFGAVSQSAPGTIGGYDSTVATNGPIYEACSSNNSRQKWPLPVTFDGEPRTAKCRPIPTGFSKLRRQCPSFQYNNRPLRLKAAVTRRDIDLRSTCYQFRKHVCCSSVWQIRQTG